LLQQLKRLENCAHLDDSFLAMKSQLVAIVAAVVLVGCGTTQQSAPAPEAKPKPPTTKAPDISVHEAAIEGDLVAVKQHLAAGTDVNAKNEDGYTPLHAAASDGHKEIIELLIAKAADVNAKGEYEWTPLHRAVLSGDNEIVELLIHAGADVNAKDDEKGTPLHFATERGNKGVVGILISKGAGLNAKNHIRQTPLDLGNRFPEIMDLLRKHGGKTKKELEAAGKPTEPVAEAAQPEPPTAKTADVSLWDAAMFGKIEAAKKAIADGANVNAKKDDGETPLHSAVVAALDSGDKEVVELLITNGAGVNAKVVSGRKQGMTPLDAANVVAKFSPLPTTVKNLSNITALLRNHGGKTGEELKAEGK